MGLQLISQPPLKQVLQAFVNGRYPKVNWVRLNTDASVIGDNSRATTGELLEIARGDGYGVIQPKSGCMEVDRAELLAVKMGMQIAWDYRIPKIIIEIDSTVVLKWLTTPIKDTHPINECMELSRKPWDCRFNLIRRDANRSAYVVPKRGYVIHCDPCYFDAPPDGVDVVKFLFWASAIGTIATERTH